MKQYRFEAESAVEFDVESAFDWYESEEPGLGMDFLEQLRASHWRWDMNFFPMDGNIGQHD